MPRFHRVIAAALAVGIAWLPSGAPLLAAPGASVRLSAAAPLPGAAWSLHLSSPYAGKPFAVEARAPGRVFFAIASGETDASGHADIELRMIDAPTLEGVNLTVRASVRATESAPLAESNWLRLRIGPTAPAERSEFVRVDDLITAGDTVAEIVRLADIDGDGDDDVLFLGSISEAAEPQYLRLLASDGSGGLADITADSIAAADQIPGRGLETADVDLDGDLDILVLAASSESDHALFLNAGDGRFARAAFPPKAVAGTGCNAACFADLDADGDPDLFLVNGITGSHDAEPTLQPNELLFNDGAGGFVHAEGFTADEDVNLPAINRAVAAGDIDGDGDLDLLIGRAGGNILLANDGSGRFTDRTIDLPPAEDSTYGAAFEDLDLDGDLDIVYANTAFNPFAQAVLFNQGGKQGSTAGQFQVGEFPAPITGQSPVRLGLTTADVDADGDSDILYPIHEFGSGEKPDLYLNQGGLQGGDAGTFVLDASFESLPGVYAAIATGDLDGDGDVDIVAPQTSTFDPEGNPSHIYVLSGSRFTAPDAPLAFSRGNVNGDVTHDLSDAVFILAHLFLGGAEPGCKAAADVNDSGTVDISDPVALLHHLFNGGVQPPAPYPGFGDAGAPLALSCDSVAIFE